jgi:hypothetical protein
MGLGRGGSVSNVTVTLHLGVVDIPYSEAPAVPKRSPKLLLRSAKSRKSHPTPRTPTLSHKSTGDVAEILEDKYHVMEIFFNLHSDFVADAFAESVAEAIENLAAGAPPTISFSAQAEQDIEADFRSFLTLREMDGLGYPGIPTNASGGKPGGRQGGVSHRFLHPYARSNPERPSFVDTGQYVASFRAWVDG